MVVALTARHFADLGAVTGLTEVFAELGRLLAPALGADTDEVLTELGLDPGEIARLRDERVVA
jgi:crotonobetainyl-CoA:carnitine CoA-transferase CaiB-like acyl-CoA transferase